MNNKIKQIKTEFNKNIDERESLVGRFVKVEEKWKRVKILRIKII